MFIIRQVQHHPAGVARVGGDSGRQWRSCRTYFGQPVVPVHARKLAVVFVFVVVVVVVQVAVGDALLRGFVQPTAAVCRRATTHFSASHE